MNHVALLRETAYQVTLDDDSSSAYDRPMDDSKFYTNALSSLHFWGYRSPVIEVGLIFEQGWRDIGKQQ